MASTYSTNLALELIGIGEQSGTWGTTTNTNLGTLLEQAISGYVTQAITDGSGANTTITIPNGTTGVARNMFIEMTGALTFSTTSLIVPANKKMYFIFNNTTGGFAVTVKVTGQTGILVPNGKKVVLTCNGTDIVEAHTAIVGNATMGGTLGVTGVATLGNGAILGTPASGTVTNLTGTASININGTVGATTPAAGAFTTLTSTLDATIYGVTVGRGAGAVSTNTAVGSSALSSGSQSGSQNTAVGYQAANTNSTGTGHSVLGYQALQLNTTGGYNTAFGYQAAKANTTGGNLVAIGSVALLANTTGSENIGVGAASLATNTTGQYNVAVGTSALTSNTTASNNTAVGYQAGYTNVSGASSTYLGYQAGLSDTASFNVYIGNAAGKFFTGTGNVVMGSGAGVGVSGSSTGTYNVLIGNNAGSGLTTGGNNTFIGTSGSSGAGQSITSGSKNTILGGYNGNQGGLDIRTASNNVVISDGDGNLALVTALNYSVGIGGALPKAGTGITFPATQSASSDANTLDDYEEGTWTPTDASGAGLSFTVTGAFYTKVGNLVTCWFELSYPATGSGLTAGIAGLPFASKNVSNYRFSTGAGYNNKSINDLILYGSYNSSLFAFYNSTGNGVTNASLSSGQITCTFSYQSA